MGSDEFSKAINQAMSLSAGMQSSLGEVMGRYLASLNLPSRAEMTSIGERLQAIEERLDRIHALLQRFAGVSAPAASEASPRSRRKAMTVTGEVQSLGPRIQAEVERAIQRNIKGLEYFTSPAPVLGATPKDR